MLTSALPFFSADVLKKCALIALHIIADEVLEDKDEEEEESEVDEKVKEVRENAQLMHATWC